MNASSIAPARLEVSSVGERSIVRLAGPLTLHTTALLWEEAEELSDAVRGRPLDIDLADVPSCDTAGAALVLHLRDEIEASSARLVGVQDQVAAMLEILDQPFGEPPQRGLRRHGRGIVQQVGEFTVAFIENVRETVTYVGALSLGLWQSLRSPRRARWGDAVVYMSRAGADALGIVVLISFLIGVILAFQMAAQLRQYGADVYVADVVTLSMVRELAPLMTAIIVAGRSGSAFAAEIGTMKVNEEVAALDTMGLERTRFLVVPKVVALLAMMPFLVLFADAAGVLGGLFIGTTFLELPIGVYLRQMVESMEAPLWDIGQGLVKGQAYALVIAAVGCLRGLQTRQGAQGVGLSATSAVVSGIFLIICVDAVLTVLFYHVG